MPPTNDFSGATLIELLARPERAVSVAETIPHLHALATTRVCFDVARPKEREFVWRGKSDGKWLSYEMYRAQGTRVARGHAPRLHRRGETNTAVTSSSAAANASTGAWVHPGMDPCVALQNTAVPLPKSLSTGFQMKKAAEMNGINLKSAKGQATSGAQLLAQLQRRAAAPATAYYTFRRRLRALRGADLRLGERANLDVNHFDCPAKLLLSGCSPPDAAHPFLGAFMPSADEWADRISAAPPFKYCRRLRDGAPKEPITRFRGVTVLLPELHANLNVGHAVKDLVFLAHVLSEQRDAAGTPAAFAVTNVLIEDASLATGNLSTRQGLLYRRASIEALVAGAQPPIKVTYLQQNTHRDRAAFGREFAGARSACFDVVLQKGLAYAGDWRGAALFREKVYARCGIAPDAEADAVLLVVHGADKNGVTTRKWRDQERLVATIKARRFRRKWCRGGAAAADGRCRPLQVIVRDMDGLDFCGQAALYARSKVVFVHHGASLANGYFLRADSLMVEMNRQWDNANRFVPTFYAAGYAGLFLSSGVAYIGARVTYGVWVGGGRKANSGMPDARGTVRWNLRHNADYDFETSNMEIGINKTRWEEVLTQVDAIIAPAPQADGGSAVSSPPP